MKAGGKEGFKHAFKDGRGNSQAFLVKRKSSWPAPGPKLKFLRGTESNSDRQA